MADSDENEKKLLEQLKQVEKISLNALKVVGSILMSPFRLLT